MAVYLSSIFRDSEFYVERYGFQVAALAEALSVPLHLVVAEGDSADATPTFLPACLEEMGLDAEVLTVDHGGPSFGSVSHPQRWAQIARVCNVVMDRVGELIRDDDQFIYVESDLVWPVETMLALLTGLGDHPAVTCMSMRGEHTFYDTWGHRKNGLHFQRHAPYHPELNGERYVELDSSGSCFATRGNLTRHVRFSPEDCILGVGRTIRENGGSLWLDQTVEVQHP